MIKLLKAHFKGWTFKSVDDWAFQATKKGERTRYFQMCKEAGHVICPFGVTRQRIAGPVGYKLWEVFDDEISCFTAFTSPREPKREYKITEIA